MAWKYTGENKLSNDLYSLNLSPISTYSQPQTTTDLIPEEIEIEEVKLNEKSRSCSNSELSFNSKTTLKSEISFKSVASSSKAKVALVSDFTTMSQLNPNSELSCVPQFSVPTRANGAVNQQNKKSYV